MICLRYICLILVLKIKALWNSSENNLYGIDKKRAIKCIPDIENYEYPNLRDYTGILYHEIDKTKKLRKDKIYNNVNK